MGVVILVACGLLLVWVVVRAVGRSKEIAGGRNRCAFCRTHLHRNQAGSGFVDVCHKCGKTQPWAKTA